MIKNIYNKYYILFQMNAKIFLLIMMNERFVTNFPKDF